MSAPAVPPRKWFAQPLETVATWWRVLRRDGIALGFTAHDRDLWIDGVLHRASPGMVPSSIRRSADFQPDSAEVEGALSHETISAEDLAALGQSFFILVSAGVIAVAALRRLLVPGATAIEAEATGSVETVARDAARAILEVLGGQPDAQAVDAAIARQVRS